jgi:hypothetical protein
MGWDGLEKEKEKLHFVVAEYMMMKEQKPK